MYQILTASSASLVTKCYINLGHAGRQGIWFVKHALGTYFLDGANAGSDCGHHLNAPISLNVALRVAFVLLKYIPRLICATFA